MLQISKLAHYRVLPKKTLIFDWTVLEDQEELEAVLWTRFRVVFLGSEIVWKLSENVSCSRTSERAEKPLFQKREPPTFFFTSMSKNILTLISHYIMALWCVTTRLLTLSLIIYF